MKMEYFTKYDFKIIIKYHCFLTKKDLNIHIKYSNIIILTLK